MWKYRSMQLLNTVIWILIHLQINRKWQMFTNQLNFCQQFLIYRNINTPLFHMRMSNAASQKGPIFFRRRVYFVSLSIIISLCVHVTKAPVQVDKDHSITSMGGVIFWAELLPGRVLSWYWSTRQVHETNSAAGLKFFPPCCPGLEGENCVSTIDMFSRKFIQI